MDNSNSSKLAESKLILMYLINKMNLPTSLSYVQEFTLSEEYMDYFTLSSYLVELEENGYINKTTENNKTNYTLSKKGYKTLELFDNLIDNSVKQNVDKYVDINKAQLRMELEVIANYTKYFDEYIVKCGAYEEKIPVVEINLRVSSKEYAKKICNNWRKNPSKHYLSFVKSLLTDQDTL